MHSLDELRANYDAVLVTVGTFDGTVLPTPGHELAGVIRNTDFLKASRKGEPMDVSGRVVVLGGGNVAYDCARTAVRLGQRAWTCAASRPRPS